MTVQRTVNLKGVALSLAAVLATFVVFQGAFFVFWDYALGIRDGPDGITDPQFARLRLTFWVLYGVMVAIALLSGAAVAWRTHVSRLVAALTLAPAVGILAYWTLGWLEFNNACNVGRSFLLESYC